MGTTLSDGLMVLSDIFLDQGGWGTVSLRWPTRERSFAAAKKGQRLLGPQNDGSRCSWAPLCVEEEADRRGQRPVRDGVVGQSSHSRLRGARLPPGAGPLGPALVSIPASWELGVGGTRSPRQQRLQLGQGRWLWAPRHGHLSLSFPRCKVQGTHLHAPGTVRALWGTSQLHSYST